MLSLANFRNPMKSSDCLKRQQGVSLLESLVAILVMALGVLGILGIQMRTLTDTQTGVRRAQAIKLIEDLSERIRTNPDGLGNLGAYTSGWATNPAVATCGGSGCDPAQLAARDLYVWKANVQNTLPLGDAAIFLSSAETTAGDRRQLGVMIGWRENERVRENDTTADTSAFKAIFAPASTASAGTSCPSGLICHLQYIQPSQRCGKYGAASSVASLYCPE